MASAVFVDLCGLRGFVWKAYAYEFSRTLLFKRADAYDLLGLLVLPPELRDLETTRAGIIRPLLEPGVDRVGRRTMLCGGL